MRYIEAMERLEALLPRLENEGCSEDAKALRIVMALTRGSLNDGRKEDVFTLLEICEAELSHIDNLFAVPGIDE